MMEQYNDVTNSKRGPHLWGEISTPEKDSHQSSLKEDLRTEGSCFPSRGHTQRPDHQPFNRDGGISPLGMKRENIRW